ncbi:hypothetical protein TNCV_4409921 [Trichonephila clavipes]|nr:hypothetical protein TNCV_4409921 [Trichonephila clavipes]
MGELNETLQSSLTGIVTLTAVPYGLGSDPGYDMDAWEHVTLFGGVRDAPKKFLSFVNNNRADIKITVAIRRDRRPPITRL